MHREDVTQQAAVERKLGRSEQRHPLVRQPIGTEPPRVVQPGTLSRANRPIAGGPVADNVLAQDGVMGRRQWTSLAGLAA
jgi:hypothetical protein